MARKKKVLVALSGGVDSSTAAFLLKKQGWEVSGIVMRMPALREDYYKAEKVCRFLGIPFYSLDVQNVFTKKVISSFLKQYQQGLTPNPCIECNRSVKFNLLFKRARELGFDYFATGHYVRLAKKQGNIFLQKGKDEKKDQSYFLYSIKKEILANLVFPLGRLSKEEVRQIARENNLPVNFDCQSQDICFVSHAGLEDFLAKNLRNCRPGRIVDIFGKVLGWHKGLCFYTVGQRRGLGISSARRLYVIEKDFSSGQLVVGSKEHLAGKGLVAERLNKFVDRLPKKVFAKIRYKHQPAACRADIQSGKCRVEFIQPQPAITPGQSVVFYNSQGLILGGGIIKSQLQGLGLG